MTGLRAEFGGPLRGSVPPVQRMGKRSVPRRQPGLGSSMTAVPHTAAIQASTCRRAQQPLRCSQREYAWQHPRTALAAKRRSPSAARSTNSVTLVSTPKRQQRPKGRFSRARKSKGKVKVNGHQGWPGNGLDGVLAQRRSDCQKLRLPRSRAGLRPEILTRSDSLRSLSCGLRFHP